MVSLCMYVSVCADDEIAAVTEFFEGSFERYFNLFLPCVVSTPYVQELSPSHTHTTLFAIYMMMMTMRMNE